MPMEKLVTVLCTVPDESTASAIARTLVSERHAACVNIISGVTSVYEWNGSVETSTELLMLIKTTSLKYHDLERALIELHPYEVPEILCFGVEDGLESYLNWVRSCVGARA